MAAPSTIKHTYIHSDIYIYGVRYTAKSGLGKVFARGLPVQRAWGYRHSAEQSLTGVAQSTQAQISFLNVVLKFYFTSYSIHKNYLNINIKHLEFLSESVSFVSVEGMRK